MRLSFALAACTLLFGCTRSEVPLVADAGADAEIDASTDVDSSKPEDLKASKIDLLLVVDNSRNVEVVQDLLAQTLPYLMGRFIRPACVNGLGNIVAVTDTPDEPCPVGKREMAPVTDVHIGVLSTSLGGHGADICSPKSPSYDAIQDDKGRLISRILTGGNVETYQGKGFLAWDPSQALVPPGEADEAVVLGKLDQMVHGVGLGGCGFEAPLESIYRFLVDPEPYETIPLVDGKATPTGLDQVVLQQRGDFLRPDSAVVVLLATDENDCSTREGGQYYLAGQGTGSNGPFHLPRARSECATNPDDACCASCGQPTPANCPPTENDPVCQQGVHDNLSDPINLRCFDQKRRFGVDFLYPVDRYTQALSETTVTNRAGDVVKNPLFEGGRPTDFVLFTAVVGVPWQDIAFDPKDLSKGYKPWHKIDWPVILGDPATLTPPTDPLMIESITPREGENPATGAALAPPGSPPLANAINGHERDIKSADDLQYACIFKRPTFKACNNSTPDCECKNADFDTNPLCQGPDGSYTNIQRYSKGLPGVRELRVVRDLGSQGVAGSVCAEVVVEATQPTFGYKPAVDAMLRELRLRMVPAPTTDEGEP
ncbi:MAG: hypothetical protein IPK82_11485 [Polyangiaceae bacterium]|nr:hypothetical protein [Polyangiaceae bacterium]